MARGVACAGRCVHPTVAPIKPVHRRDVWISRLKALLYGYFSLRAARAFTRRFMPTATCAAGRGHAGRGEGDAIERGAIPTRYGYGLELDASLDAQAPGRRASPV